MTAPSRAEAIRRGLTRYQGRPCGRGHGSERYVGNCGCCQCVAEYGRRWRAGGVATKAAKTHCPHGHPYSTENTYTHHGKRFCRTCHRKQSRDHERRIRALAKAHWQG